MVIVSFANMIPKDAQERLESLDQDFREGNISEAAYYEKQWVLLKSFVPPKFELAYKCLYLKMSDGEVALDEKMKDFIISVRGHIKECNNMDKLNTDGTVNGNVDGSSIDGSIECKSDSSRDEETQSVSLEDTDRTRSSSDSSIPDGLVVKVPVPASPPWRRIVQNVKEEIMNVHSFPTVDDFVGVKRSAYEAANEYLKSHCGGSRGTEEESEDWAHFGKKMRLDEGAGRSSIVGSSSGSSEPRANEEIQGRCSVCFQPLRDVRPYSGHPPSAVEELVALTDPKFNLFSGGEVDITEGDERPQLKITDFSVYDTEGHLCSFDGGLIERNVLLYFSGYLKQTFDDDPTIDGGVPTKDLGPINQWWIASYDGGDRALIGLSTPYAEYYLLEPNRFYAPHISVVREKIFLSKLVIEFLLEYENPTYEDLISKIESSNSPHDLHRMTEETLLRHAQFICDQVVSYDEASEVDEGTLITNPCMRSLIQIAGVTFGERKSMRQLEKLLIDNCCRERWSRATSTPLVQNVFETYFRDHLNVTNNNQNEPVEKCGACKACLSSDCGSCIPCLNREKFGSALNQAEICLKRRCPKVAVEKADESESEQDPDVSESDVVFKSPRVGNGSSSVSWCTDAVLTDETKTYYRSAVIEGNLTVSVGDCVLVEPPEPEQLSSVGRVAFMWQNHLGLKMMHIQWFYRSSETILGDVGDPRELFEVDSCEDTLLSNIISLASVVYRPAGCWAGLPDMEKPETSLGSPSQSSSFFYKHRYEDGTGRFEDATPLGDFASGLLRFRYCASCERQVAQSRFDMPIIQEYLEELSTLEERHYGLVTWRGELYRPGFCAYFEPSCFNLKTYPSTRNPTPKKSDHPLNEDVYPELYRKPKDQIVPNNTPEPFSIGLITSIFVNSNLVDIKPSDIHLRVLKFYRPENTYGVTNRHHRLDVNLLFASNDEIIVPFDKVCGKCIVLYRENIETDLNEWSLEGPNRFYFNDSYDHIKRVLLDPSKVFKQLGDAGKGQGKGKSKPKLHRQNLETECWPPISRRLRCFDIFSGCGGFSEGLFESGVAKIKWAVESDPTAADSFRANNPGALVYTEDCNLILKLVMNGRDKTDRGMRIPLRGEVEILCGGPPCQGFNGMNKFTSRQYSLFKNSLVVTYLSFCDYYRPRFFILENVRNFVLFKKGMVLKLTLKCLLRMGYQVAYGVMEVGNFGLPQNKKKTVIIAAAPGEMLPKLPSPTHVFNRRLSHLSFIVDGKKFCAYDCKIDSAPYRSITVRDAISDLPPIGNVCELEEMSYGGEAMSHFQRLLRGDECESVLRDHISKEMAPIVEARIRHIPLTSGADWRDLPNLEVLLCDGSFSRKLRYNYHDKKNGNSSTGALRGVCSCAAGEPCDPMARQSYTLIPWCLPHTGNSHNNWPGLYSRLEWDGVFTSAITNPEPLGRLGSVIHPEQHRVVSVRECARSQGFADKYRFCGALQDRYRQIGNAVPPPMGCAIGRELRLAVSIRERTARVRPAPGFTHLTS